MRSKPDDYRSIALRAARDFDVTIGYLRSGRIEDALRSAVNAAHDLRYELSHQRRPVTSKRSDKEQSATPLPS